MATPKGLAARAIIETSRDKSKLYIEVREGNRFSNFYYTYSAIGRGRGRIVTTGSPRHRGFATTLEEALQKIIEAMKAHAKRTKTEIQIHTTVRIYRKRLYRKLLSMRPDELGLSYVRPLPERRVPTRTINLRQASSTSGAKPLQSVAK